jgi:hypothetical protein
MADYRCYCQDREDQIVSRYDISAPDLDAALREVYPPQDTPDGADAGSK